MFRSTLVGQGPHLVGQLSPDLGGEHRPKSVPPEAHRLMTDLNTALLQHVFDVAERQWEPDVEHHRQADDLCARFEVPEDGALSHLTRLDGGRPIGLNQLFSDRALRYAIRPNCSMRADGGQMVQRKEFLPQRRPKNPKITKTMTTRPTMYMICFIVFPSVRRVANDHLGNRSTPKFPPN